MLIVDTGPSHELYKLIFRLANTACLLQPRKMRITLVFDKADSIFPYLVNGHSRPQLPIKNGPPQQLRHAWLTLLEIFSAMELWQLSSQRLELLRAVLRFHARALLQQGL
jgi:hypothetical protein